MEKAELVEHLMNDAEFKYLRLWGEIAYALERGRNPSRVELSDYMAHGGGIPSFWQYGMRRVRDGRV